MRVLLLDDHPEVLASLELLLKAAGYDVQAAGTAAEALAAQQARPADVLVTDIFMPDSDGLETISAFRARWPGLTIIAMSGGGQRVSGDYLDTASLAGADRLLRKPFDPAQLLALLREQRLKP